VFASDFAAVVALEDRCRLARSASRTRVSPARRGCSRPRLGFEVHNLADAAAAGEVDVAAALADDLAGSREQADLPEAGKALVRVLLANPKRLLARAGEIQMPGSGWPRRSDRSASVLRL